ncbi:hypothetical protein VTN00DRAFT_7142 [Thermoascus crustaceus]|uniref:uncharacterized protein n=1 Tax=Thermoascus crustaceus TaxID=5088 RepID=UPI0037438612
MIVHHRKHLDRGKTSDVYLHFSHLPASQINRIVNRPEREIFEKHPVAYDMGLGSLIVKARIFPYGIRRTHFGKMFYITAKSMNLDDNLMPDGSATVMGPTAANSPDDSYQPYPLPPGRSDEWPTLVVDVGYSDMLEHLTTNAKWWLGNSGGDVKVAVVITVDERQPVIQIEAWQNPAPPPAPNRP